MSTALIWVMPEERDEIFTKELMDNLQTFASQRGMVNFSIEIAEKYEDEETPHYHMKVQFGVFLSNTPIKTVNLTAVYKASAHGEVHNGVMNLTLVSDASESTARVIVGMAFRLYDAAILKYYPEWKTQYVSRKIV